MTAYISNLSVFAKTIILLVISNFFMLTAWYYHLKHLSDKPWYVAAAVSWGIAFFEYTVHIPANRIGHAELTLAQLQILQVGMSLIMFMPFTYFMMDHPINSDYLLASLCLAGAGYFIFRGIV